MSEIPSLSYLDIIESGRVQLGIRLDPDKDPLVVLVFQVDLVGGVLDQEQEF